VAVSPLRGGTSSAVHALTFAGGRELVLRRFVRTDWLAEEPDAPAREVAALEIAERCAVPTPRLVAADPEGAEAGDPAVLRTRLPGAVVWRPPAVEPFLEGLAALLPAIHDTPAAPGDLPAYAPYRLETDEPPPAARDRGVWQAAFALCAAEPPPRPRCSSIATSIPATSSGRTVAVTGLVDWASAAIGPAAADAGHCRWNLARTLGQDAADRFLALCGLPYHPYWDVVAALGGYDAAALAAKPPAEEAFLAAAVRLA